MGRDGSDADYMFEHGLTPTHGGLLHDRFYDEDSDDYEYNTDNKPTWFATAQEAQEYAKNNIGIVITRSPEGNGYIVKNKENYTRY